MNLSHSGFELNPLKSSPSLLSDPKHNEVDIKQFRNSLPSNRHDHIPIRRPSRRKPSRWRSVFVHCTSCLFVTGLVMALIFITLQFSQQLNYFDPMYPVFGGCDAAGNFNAGIDSYSVWSTSQTFVINLAFGSMTFSRAKFIDVIWDVVVGRGVQGLLGFILYRVFTKSLSRIMERSSVSLATFDSVAVQGSTLMAFGTLASDFFSNNGIRPKLTVSWMVLALAYVLMFQTLMSAMTGYSATSQPFVQVPNGNQIPWDAFHLVNYVIHDGWRIGLEGNYLVAAISDSTGEDFLASENICSSYGFSNSQSLEGLKQVFQNATAQEIFNKCQMTWAVSNYTSIYGFDGLNHTSSTFNPNSATRYNLTAPSLNISASYLRTGASLFGSPYGSFRNAQGLVINGPFTKFGNSSFALFVRSDQPDNRTYDINYLRENGRCQQGSTYQWGFSFLLLFIALLLTTLWALGMWAMYLDAYFNSTIDAIENRDMGSWRAALDLAHGIQESLDGDKWARNPQSASGTWALGDNEIRRRILSNAGGGRIGYAGRVSEVKGVTRLLLLHNWLSERNWGRFLIKRRVWVGIFTVFVVLPLIIIVPMGVTGFLYT